MKIYISILFLVTVNFCYGQYSIRQDLLNRTVLIILGNNSGSGFLYKDSVATYLITAKHVLFESIKDKNGKEYLKFRKDSIKVITYPNEYDKSEPYILNFDLQCLSKDGNIKYTQQRDVVVIKIGQSVQKPYDGTLYSSCLDRNGSKPSRINVFNFKQICLVDSVLIGNDVFIFGYPTSLGLVNFPQYNFFRPLLRKGALAGRDLSLKNIIIDCPSYPGNSGGPVLMFKDNSTTLIGIVIQFIPYEDLSKKDPILSNSGYSVVEPMDIIMELITQF